MSRTKTDRQKTTHTTSSPHHSTGRAHPKRTVQSFDEPLLDAMFDRLRDRRIALKKTQKQIAADTGCSVRTVVFMETHQHMPNLSLFLRYAQALDYTFVLHEQEPRHS